jgi:hypothetical protein
VASDGFAWVTNHVLRRTCGPSPISSATPRSR